MALFDVDELIENMTRAFHSRDADPFLDDEDLPGSLDLWDDPDDDSNPFWNDHDRWKDKDFRDRFDKMTITARERALARKTAASVTPGSSAHFQAAQAATGISKKQAKRLRTTGDLAAKALTFRGEEYEWGGTTRATGLDCSGLIWRIMNNSGYDFAPRHSSAIYEHSNKVSLKKAINTRGAILYTPGHIAISLGNGKTIEARGEEYGVVIGDAHGRFKYGGILPELQVGKGNFTRKPKQAARAAARRVRQAVPYSPQGVAAVNPVESMKDPFQKTREDMPLVVLDVADEVFGRKEKSSKDYSGLTPIERQMKKGFIEAGRPDLARMVGTKAFDLWVAKETGVENWATDRDAGRVTSPANNQGLANDGYFQVWRGHSYNSNGEVSRMSAREQAYLIATKFDLTADDIKRYAKEVRQGSYKGWG